MIWERRMAKETKAEEKARKARQERFVIMPGDLSVVVYTPEARAAALRAIEKSVDARRPPEGKKRGDQ